MDRFFVEKKNINLENNTCTIEGEDVKHISKVLRCKIGEELEVCDSDNNEYICEITHIDKSNVELDILEKELEGIAEFSLLENWEKGGEGAIDIANKIVKIYFLQTFSYH